MEIELFAPVILFIISNVLLVGWLLKDIFQKVDKHFNPLKKIQFIEVKRDVINLRKRVELSENMIESFRERGEDYLEYIRQIAARDFSKHIVEENLLYFKEEHIPSYRINPRDKCFELRLDVLKPNK